MLRQTGARFSKTYLTVRLGAAPGPGLAPPVELAPVEHVGLAHGGQGRRPEPAPDVVGLEPGQIIFIALYSLFS